ncbi:DMT family transporter [Alphaproteobacteria bacterium]|nr:DMT family transporter [Alphaproteobacteria bacterium]
MTRNQAHLLLLLVTIFWGFTFVAQKTGMETIGPMSFTAARYLIGSIGILPIALFEFKKNSILPLFSSNKRLVLQTIGLGLFMFGGISLQQIALQYTNIANAAFLTALYVPAVPLINWLITRHPIKSKIWLALIISLSGSWLLSGSGTVLSQWGDLLIICSVFFWAGHILLIGHVTRKINAPFQISIVQSFICFILSFGFAGILEKPELLDFMPAIPEIILAGFFSVTLGFSLQIVGQRYSDPTACAFILSLESVFGALAGWLLLSQILGVSAFSGCLLIFMAVIIADIMPDRWITLKLIKGMHK